MLDTDSKISALVVLVGVACLTAAFFIVRQLFSFSITETPVSRRPTRPVGNSARAIFKQNKQGGRIAFQSRSASQWQAGQDFIIDIVPQEEISALSYRLEITFDPAVVTIQEITPGSFFNQPKVLERQIDNQTGKVSLVVGPVPQKNFSEPSGRQPLASLKGKVVSQPSQAEAIFSFAAETTIVSDRDGKFQNSEENLLDLAMPIAP